MRNKFLLHACCAPCAVYVIKVLQERGFEVTVFFYNPNIHPLGEYEKRRDELMNYCQQKEISFIEGEYEIKKWFGLVRGLENEPEGGKRCEVCYRMRLQKTAELAVQGGYAYFGSTLSISPHKKADKINEIGQQLVVEYGVEFYAENWKKKDGFKISCEMSRQQGFYRQTYCGCVYSQKH